MDNITIALAKGRIAKLAGEDFAKSGIVCDAEGRKLSYTDKANGITFIWVKADDVPTYVEYGVADAGIVGKDTLLEREPDLYEVLDLGYGKCRVCVCGMAGGSIPQGRVKVATKYPNIARDYFTNVRGTDAEIIKLNGSVELAPLFGLSHVIVDIVESGKTLQENGLAVYNEICTVTARLVVNRVSMKLRREEVTRVINALK